MQGDKLASGGSSATFPAPRISQAKWDAIWEDEPSTVEPPVLDQETINEIAEISQANVHVWNVKTLRDGK